jgi:high affinity sulfate transporter 1
MPIVTDDAPRAVATWLPRYRRAWLSADLVAGTTLAAFVVPESLAYAELAGLPPASGLYCYLFAGLVYALLGTSRTLAIGPTSALSLAVAVTLGTLAAGDPARHVSLAATAAILVGAIALGAWMLRLGSVMYFISDTILSGFKIGAALVIASTQIPKLLGIEGAPHGFVAAIAHLASHFRAVHAPSAAIGGAALLLLLAGDALLPHRPVALFVIAAALAVGPFVELGRIGVKLVGDIPSGLPGIAVPHVDLADIPALLPLAFACFVLGCVEGTSVARTFADRGGDTIDTNRELLALGVTNVVVGLGRGFPVSGGTSQSAVNDTAGAKSPLSLVVTSLWVAVVLLVATGLFRGLPQPMLAALVIAAVARLVRFDQLRALWAASGSAFAVAVLTVLAVLLLGILQGILVATLFSLALLIRAIASPPVAELGRLPGTDLFREIARHPDGERVSGVLVVRPQAELVYFNVASVSEQVLALVARSPDPVRAVVLDLALTPTIDVSTARALGGLHDRLTARGAELRLAESYPAVREQLRTLAPRRHFGTLDARLSVGEAVAQAAREVAR